MDAPGTGAAAKDSFRQGQAVPDNADLSQSLSASEPADPCNNEPEVRHRWRRRFTIATVVAMLIAAAVVLPPLVNIGRYKHQITALMTRSLGRPVRMSSVGLRLLPMPGFVLQDLSVSEDPHYGSEPVLSAGTVIARVNLSSLWRGRLEISRISVDEASLNLVRASDGRWNIDSLMLGAQPALTGRVEPGKPVPRSFAHFPYLEATDSRVNLKYGDEKKPYALTGTDLSLWQDSPGQWRFRLRGLPARTDIPMSAADAGELRAEGSLRSAATLRNMPLSLQIEWREAQLGQLSRLLLGSDSGWRGDVTADIEVHGTAENAQTRSRLRVLGIRREEFTPQTALNFEANCTLRYQHSLRAVHDVACDTDSGGGQIHLRADLPGVAAPPHGTLEVHDVPLQGGLDLLRAVRSGFAPGVALAGKVSGNLSYAQPELSAPAPAPHSSAQQARLTRGTRSPTAPQSSALRGELIVVGASLEGDALKEPLTLPRMSWTPIQPEATAVGKKQASPNVTTGPATAQLALGTRIMIPVGTAKSGVSQPEQQSAASLPATGNGSQDKPKTAASKPLSAQAAETEAPRTEAQALTVQLALGRNGYEAQIDGAGNIARLRELAYALGAPHLDAANALSGSADQLSVSAVGPWLLSSDIGVESSTASTPQESGAEQTRQPAQGKHAKSARSVMTLPEPDRSPARDSLTGMAVLRRAVWTPSFLLTPVILSQATLHLSSTSLTFASDFTFGGTKEPAKSTETKAAEPKATGSGPAAAASLAASSAVVRGSVIINSPVACATAECRPQLQLHFASLDAADLQSALLNAPRPKGFFAPLIDSMRSSQPAKLPDFDAGLDVANLTVGSLTFPFSAKLHPQHGDFLVDNWTAGLFGGSAQGTGQVTLADGKPAYSLEGSFKQANGSSLSAFADLHASGGTVSGSGQIQLSGLTGKDLAASATGQIQFDWRGGSIPVPNQPGSAPSRFDNWSGTANLSRGKAELGVNSLVRGKQTITLSGSMPFGEPAKLSIASSAAKPEPKSPSPVQ